MQVFVGGEYETQSVANMTTLVDAGYRYGIPVLGVTAVGKELTRDARYLGLATRICAELGAQVVKTYYCAEGFEQVTAGCPVPIVMAGGKKLPELEALEMAYRAVQEGAAGVDMGRNIFQSRGARGDDPGRRARSCTTTRARPRRTSCSRSSRGRARPSDADDGAASCSDDGPRLSVGMLTADLLHLDDELAALDAAGIELVHVDVMDGVFCPMMTVGPPVVKALPDRFVKDVHLMIDEPLTKVQSYVDAGAGIVTIHVESTRHPHRVLQSLARNAASCAASR